MCFGKNCTRYGKSIQRDVIERAFAELLQTLTPKPGLLELAKAMFRDAWAQRLSQASAAATAYDTKVRVIEAQIAALLDRIVEASSERVIAAYEKRVCQLEQDKIGLVEREPIWGRRQRTFEETLELALRFSQTLRNLANW